MGRVRIVLTALLLLASAVVTGISVTVLPFYNNLSGKIEPLAVLTVVLWLLFAASLLTLRRVDRRASIVLVVAGSLAIGGAALLGPPNTSTDSARYAWDGIVQKAGISPYDHVPADAALTDLRPEWLFPAPVVGPDGEPACAGARIMAVEEPGTGELVCTAINRATVPTIYPPTSEIAFLGIRLFVGADQQYWPMQLAGFVLSLATTLLLLRTLITRGRDPRWAALWGWSPLVATEGITNSHIDILGAFLLLLATVLVASNRRWLAGIALGASIATKLIPAIGTPALLRPRPWPILLGAAGTFALLYVPYLFASGFGVLGYLPGYLGEEGYETGSRFLLLSVILPGASATVAVGVLVLVTAALVWWKSNPLDPWLPSLIMIGTVLLIVTPRYPWYALLLIPFIAMTGRWEWMLVPLALTQRLMNPSLDLSRVCVLIAIAIIVLISLRRAGENPLKHWRERVIGARTRRDLKVTER